jgi:CBS domain-containing protein
MVKLAIKLAGEAGRNVTREDVMASFTVNDVMSKDVVTIGEQEPVNGVLKQFAERDQLVYPVVDAGKHMVGTLSLAGLREVLAVQHTWEWLLAGDVMSPPEAILTGASSLKEALDTMGELQVEQLVVIGKDNARAPAGILDTRKAKLAIDEELLRREQAQPAAQVA